MTTAAEKLAAYGISMEFAHAFVAERLGDLPTILAIAQQYGITNDMLGEIAGWPGAAYPGDVVEQFFASNGIDSSSLDAVGPASVSTVGDASITEGQTLDFLVTMTSVTTAPLTMDFVIGGGTAAMADYGTATASDGVTIQGTSITIPAGVTSFHVSLPTVDDGAAESSETLNVYVGNKTGHGTIADNDSLPTSNIVDVVGEPTATEGVNLVFLVTLKAATTAPTPISFYLAPGTAQPADIGAATFTDGVVFDGGRQLTVPAGVSSFVINVPTVQDTAKEAFETVLIAVDGVQSTGYIADDDQAAMLPVQFVELVGSSGIAG